MKQKKLKTDFNIVDASLLILLPVTSVRRYRSYWFLIFFYFSTSIFIYPVGSSGNQLYRIGDDFMYKNKHVECPLSVFSPSDEININIRFIQLQKGNYSFLTEWYNPLGKIQTSSAFKFALNKRSDYPLWSLLKLHKASKQKRFVSFSHTRNYHMKLFGMWKVILYLNGEKVVEKAFEVR